MRKTSNITITHLNIRESISILLLKIITLDLIAATCTILFFAVSSFSPSDSFNEKILSYNVLVFVILGIFKISLTVYVVLLWLNEYYEVTSDAIIHKRGFINRITERYQLAYVRTMKLDQSIWGKMFNFGTIELYDIRRKQKVELYLIHNPYRCARILEKLIDNPQQERHEIRTHFFEKDYEDN